VAAPAYRLAFFTMGVVTVFSALIFRKLDAKPTPLLTKNLEAEAVQAR
jgi:DHA2 family multidrug resistance protein-like MFS transporter